MTVIRVATIGGAFLMPAGKRSDLVLVARRPDGVVSSWTASTPLIASDSTGRIASYESFTLNPTESHRVFDASLVTIDKHVIETEWIIQSPYRR